MATTKDSSVVPAAAQVVNRDDFSYLPPPETFYAQQGLREKIIAKTKENPFVPLGVIFTTAVLCMGVATMRSERGRRTQLLMRLRVGGQAFAIFAMLAGIYHKTKTGQVKR